MGVDVMAAEALAEDALRWLVDSATLTEAGLAWSGRRSDPELDPSLYSGAAGITMALLEARVHFVDESYGDLAIRAGRQLTADVETWQPRSLYFGLAGPPSRVREVLSPGACGQAACGLAWWVVRSPDPAGRAASRTPSAGVADCGRRSTRRRWRLLRACR